MKETHEKPIKIEPQKPNAILYWLLAPLAKIVAFFKFNTRVIKDKEVKKLKTPFLAIGTHSSPLDVVFMLTALIPRRLNVVCGRDVFTWKPIKPIAKLAGLIPISQFSMDLNSIRMIKKAVDAGCSLSLFPEGKISLDGRQLHFLSPSLAKLIKLLNVPVVMCHNYGGYTSKPKWFSGFKRGRVEQRIRLLFTKDELNDLSVDEIYNILKESFEYNDHIYQIEKNIRYKSKKPALGLSYILYKCPKCKAEYEIESTNRHLTCKACNNKVEYTEYGKLVPIGDSVTFNRIDEWYDFQRKSVRHEINQEDYKMSYPVVWEESVNNVYNERGEGMLTLTNDSITFTGKDFNNNDIIIKSLTKNLSTIVQKRKEAVDLTIGGIVNRFYFKDGKYSVKYTISVEEIYRKIHNL